MNYSMIIDELSAYSKEEIMYREFFRLCKNRQPLTPFFEKYKAESEELSYLIHPEAIASTTPEDRFISLGRNVSIVKHPRYFPVFYHGHSFFEMIYVLSGKCRQIFTDREILLKAGDLCIMAPNVTHGIDVSDDSVILNILIRHSTFLDIFINTVRDKTQISMFFLNNIYEKNKVPYLLFHTKGDPVIRNYVLDMYIEQIHLDEYSDRIICSILTIFFTQLMRLHKSHLEISRSTGNKNSYETEIFNYIVNHYDNLTLEQLAEHFHFSVPYCSRLIKKTAGLTFSELQENIRLQQGENYLLYTQMSVNDISEKIGFKNPETFIRMFKRRHRMTPSKYRKIAESNTCQTFSTVLK